MISLADNPDPCDCEHRVRTRVAREAVCVRCADGRVRPVYVLLRMGAWIMHLRLDATGYAVTFAPRGGHERHGQVIAVRPLELAEARRLLTAVYEDVGDDVDALTMAVVREVVGG